MRDDSGSKDWPALIAAIADRKDAVAFKTLFEFFAPRIKTMLLRSGAPADVAEDIAQEALVTVFHKASYYDASRAGAAAWIYTIARNIRIDRLRHERRSSHHLLLNPPDLEAPERSDASLDNAEREQRVKQAMQRLPDEQVRVVELSFFEGRTHGEISDLLCIPLGTVKSRLRLAMARLRESLSDFR